jgi:putative sterol carrier protein
VAKVPFLSEGWLELHRTLGTALPERPGVSGRVQHIVTGTPDGEVRYVQTIVDGRITEVTLGADDRADVTYTHTYADAQAIARGELDATVAAMQGRVKTAGDIGKVMALMPLSRSEELRSLLADCARQTSY